MRAGDKAFRDQLPGCWSSEGKLKGGLLLFTAEQANPSPYLYTWSQPSSTILLQEPGLYELTLFSSGQEYQLVVGGVEQGSERVVAWLRGRERVAAARLDGRREAEGRAALTVRRLC